MKSTDELIAENTKYFKFYEKVPIIFTVILGALFFILSIVGIASESYGTAFLFIFIGAIVCVANYFVLKLAFSYIILHISYLKKIEENTKKSDIIVENTRKADDIVENTGKTESNE